MATPKKPARRVRTPREKRVKKRLRHDWEALRVEYVTGAMSQLDLCAARKVHPRSVSQRAAREGWDAARKKHRADSAAKTQTVAVEWRARTEAELHRKAHDIMLDLLAGASKMAVAMKDGGKPDDVKKTVEAVTLALKTARQTAGLPAEPTGPTPGSTSTGDTVIRRTAPDGSTVVVTVAAPPP